MIIPPRWGGEDRPGWLGGEPTGGLPSPLTAAEVQRGHHHLATGADPAERPTRRAGSAARLRRPADGAPNHVEKPSSDGL